MLLVCSLRPAPSRLLIPPQTGRSLPPPRAKESGSSPSKIRWLMWLITGGPCWVCLVVIKEVSSFSFGERDRTLEGGKGGLKATSDGLDEVKETSSCVAQPCSGAVFVAPDLGLRRHNFFSSEPRTSFAHPFGVCFIAGFLEGSMTSNSPSKQKEREERGAKCMQGPPNPIR